MALAYGFCLDELSGMYDSAQFSDAFHAVLGDGAAESGTQFAASLNGFTVTVGSGYAFAAGRWLENGEPLSMTIPASENNVDRTDAVAVRVDYGARKVSLELLADVDPDKFPDILRNEGEYSIVLYLIRVPRGASTLTPDNIVDVRSSPDLCGRIAPLSSVSGDVLRIHSFLQGGIDSEVDRVIGLSQAVIEKAEAGIAHIDAELKRVGGGPEIGELRTARLAPSPAENWLLCDGGSVPDGYQALSVLLNGTLPDLSRPDDRYRTYIYGGTPKGVDA